MARRVLGKLTARGVASAGPGRHSDGGGLYLVNSGQGRGRWVLRYTLDGRIRDMGLGSVRYVGLAEARAAAEEARRAVRAGRDPVEERRKKRRECALRRTFGEVADACIQAKAASWRNAKHAAQWTMTLSVYAGPLRDRYIDEVTTEDVLAVLQPLWSTKQETASRLRGRIASVLDYASFRGWRNGENPARWRGHLAESLGGRRRLQRGHHAAMPYTQVPAFVAGLGERSGTAALALEFLILTAARTSEVLGARFDEFDLDAGVWTVPASRMKADREHRVPLPPRALAIVTSLAAARRSDIVFPGAQGRPLSVMALAMALRRAGVTNATVHGFRSSFRDWAAEQTDHAGEVCEAALAHVVANKVEAAYRRGDLFRKRRALMDDWARFVGAAPEGSDMAD